MTNHGTARTLHPAPVRCRVVPFDEEEDEESPFVGLLKVEAA
jgi:hypothetical protein